MRITPSSQTPSPFDVNKRHQTKFHFFIDNMDVWETLSPGDVTRGGGGAEGLSNGVPKFNEERQLGSGERMCVVC